MQIIGSSYTDSEENTNTFNNKTRMQWQGLNRCSKGYVAAGVCVCVGGGCGGVQQRRLLQHSFSINTPHESVSIQEKKKKEKEKSHLPR